MTNRPSLVAGWVAGWRERPDRTVLVEASSGTEWTGSRLDRVTADITRVLLASGVRPGDHVVLSAAPSAATVTAFVAVLRAGAVVVPVSTEATRRELEHVVATVGASVAVADAPDRFAGLAEAFDVDALQVERAQPPASPSDVAFDAAGPESRALVCFTSGTTGQPKGAPLTHGNVETCCRALIDAWRWTADDVLVSALPLFHVHGLVVALATTLTAGSRIVVVDRFSPEAVAAAVEAHAATLVFGVPTMWSRMADAGVLPRLRRCRLVASGSAPLPAALFERIEAAIGSAPLERYGMTETLIITSTPVEGERHAGTVGVPLPGMQVRLAADGVVEVRGASVFAGYLGRDRGDEWTPDGWFRTGDVGELDDDGCLRLVGRSSDLIITGGYNVYPREVEDVLLRDTRVLDVAVVGIPDETWGEVVVAAVVLVPEDGGPVLSDLAAMCAEQLSPYKRPRAWHAVDSLPRNAMGKVDRDALRRSLGRHG